MTFAAEKTLACRSSLRDRIEAHKLHPALRFAALHEVLPDKSGAIVLHHEHADALIDAEHIDVGPLCARIEGVDEAVPFPRASAVLVVKVLQDGNRFFWEEWRGARRGARHHGPIDASDLRRATPSLVSPTRVGGGDAPGVVVVIGEAP